jgi:adenosine 3'-phospho 5'-phosphosulfate transporter B2
LFSDVDSAKSAKKLIVTTLPGIVCLLGYLISDSFTSTWQDNLIKKYSMSSMAMMFMTNLYSCLYTFLSMTYQGEFFDTIRFVQTHDEIMDHVLLLSMASAIGQIFIFMTIQKFGALVFTLIMTTRQLFAILLSTLLFNHSLSAQSIFGICLIFCALFGKQLLSFVNKKKRTNEKIIA